MKVLVLLCVTLFSCATSTHAGDAKRKPAAATGLTNLTGADAIQMVKILEDAGITASKTMVQGFAMVCQGSGYQDLCMVSTQPNDPAAHRVFIKSASSGQFWSLLKRAGLPQAISNLSDGTAGQWVITGNSVTCSFNSGGGSEECVVN
jgi:hypothetical protein